VEAAVTTKSQAWSYEEEFRFLRSRSGAMAFEPEALVEVILGFRMNQRDRQTILNLLEHPQWAHVSVREVVKHKHAPTFTIKKLGQ